MIKLPYNRIISYGCSFTAGSELGDAEVLGMTEEEMRKLVKKHSFQGAGAWQFLRDCMKLSCNDADELL